MSFWFPSCFIYLVVYVCYVFRRVDFDYNLLGTKELSFTVVALHVNFSLPERNFLLGFCTDDSGRCPKCHNC